MHPNSAIAQLVFMVCAMTMVVIPDCKLMLKIVFTVKLVISKTQSKILFGLAQKAVVGSLSKYVRQVARK